MRLFIDTDIKIRKRLTRQEIKDLVEFSLWFDNKVIAVQKCTVPEGDMQDLIDVINAVAKTRVLAVWEEGALRIN